VAVVGYDLKANNATPVMPDEMRLLDPYRVHELGNVPRQ
jgi:hypothetical protein